MTIGVPQARGLGITVADNGIDDNIGYRRHKLVQAGVAGVALAVAAERANAGALDHFSPRTVIGVFIVGHKAITGAWKHGLHDGEDLIRNGDLAVNAGGGFDAADDHLFGKIDLLKILREELAGAHTCVGHDQGITGNKLVRVVPVGPDRLHLFGGAGIFAGKGLAGQLNAADHFGLAGGADLFQHGHIHDFLQHGFDIALGVKRALDAIYEVLQLGIAQAGDIAIIKGLQPPVGCEVMAALIRADILPLFALLHQLEDLSDGALGSAAGFGGTQLRQVIECIKFGGKAAFGAADHDALAHEPILCSVSAAAPVRGAVAIGRVCFFGGAGCGNLLFTAPHTKDGAIRNLLFAFEA